MKLRETGCQPMLVTLLQAQESEKYLSALEAVLSEAQIAKLIHDLSREDSSTIARWLSEAQHPEFATKWYDAQLLAAPIEPELASRFKRALTFGRDTISRLTNATPYSSLSNANDSSRKANRSLLG